MMPDATLGGTFGWLMSHEQGSSRTGDKIALEDSVALLVGQCDRMNSDTLWPAQIERSLQKGRVIWVGLKGINPYVR